MKNNEHGVDLIKAKAIKKHKTYMLLLHFKTLSKGSKISLYNYISTSSLTNFKINFQGLLQIKHV